MTGADILIWGAILALAIWGPYRIFHSMRRDRAWPQRVERFAQAHALREVQADALRESDPPGHDWNRAGHIFQRRNRSANPSLHRPVAGTAVLHGELRGLPFFFDQVIFKRNNRIRIYARMAVDVPGMPSTLEVSPLGSVRRFLRALTPRRAAPPGRPSPRNYLLRYSKNPAGQVREQTFPTADLVQALDNAHSENGKIYLANGKLYLISDRHGNREIDLNGMYDDLNGIVSIVLATGRTR
ncbi:hypothetical protein C6366_00535 [Desulfonatronum sp. SC1]|nr:hypothetical protein C6366_00535 [Desulfonatronum sp. SC1]